MTPAHVLALFVAAFPTFLAFGAVTTAVNQFCDKFLKSRLPRFVHVVDTLCVDYIKCVQAAAKFIPPGKNDGFIRRDALVAITMLALAGLAPLAIALGCAELKAAEAAASPVLSVVDAIGHGVANVVGWCDEHGVDAKTVATAKQAIADRDYATAVTMAADLVSKARAAGDPIPQDVEVTLRMAEGLIAAHAIEVGMGAVSK